MPIEIQSLVSFLNANATWLFIILVLWTLPWKGVALWKAARLSHNWWFIIMLVINTLGILEIIYIFYVARKYTVVEETESGEVIK